MTNKLKTIVADETHPLRPDFDNLHTDKSDRFRIPNSKTTRYLQSFIPTVIRTQLHDTYSHSFQRSFGHNYTIPTVIHSNGHSDTTTRYLHSFQRSFGHNYTIPTVIHSNGHADTTTRYLQSFIPTVIRTPLHDTYSQSFQRSFGHHYTIPTFIPTVTRTQSTSRQMNTTRNG